MTALSPEPTLEDTATVRVSGLRRAYGDKTVIDNLDLTVRRGEFLALIGPSGCGKTTLLRTLGGLDQPDGGELAVPGKVAMVFQEARLLPWRRAWQNVLTGLPKDARRKDRAYAALSEVGLDHRVDAWPEELSGGQAQRVSIARALVRDPELLLLDEPFAAVDALTRVKMHELVAELISRHQPATVLVTHDLDEAILLADRIAVMSSGRILSEVVVPAELERDREGEQFRALRGELLRTLTSAFVESSDDDGLSRFGTDHSPES